MNNSTAGTKMTIINGVPLSSQELRELEKIYGQKPKPGRYWYDKLSGLYGSDGQPAMGFMYAGHEFGTVAQNASNGNTGILINGRELTQTEYMLLCQLIGSTIFPGSYWLDAQGNAGIQGNPAPLVNLFMTAKQSINSAGTGGDNFWSTRYSAGNYTDDNSAGYVSVPGYGPVSYGM